MIELTVTARRLDLLRAAEAGRLFATARARRLGYDVWRTHPDDGLRDEKVTGAVAPLIDVWLRVGQPSGSSFFNRRPVTLTADGEQVLADNPKES